MIVSTLIKHCSSFPSGKQKRKGFAEGINEIENNPDIQTREQIDAILKEQGVELPPEESKEKEGEANVTPAAAQEAEAAAAATPKAGKKGMPGIIHKIIY